MKLFEIIPSELFSILASPNRGLYADALDVLYEAYQENLKIPEDTLYSMLRSKLEQQLADATFEEEDKTSFAVIVLTMSVIFVTELVSSASFPAN